MNNKERLDNATTLAKSYGKILTSNAIVHALNALYPNWFKKHRHTVDLNSRKDLKVGGAIIRGPNYLDFLKNRKEFLEDKKFKCAHCGRTKFFLKNWTSAFSLTSGRLPKYCSDSCSKSSVDAFDKRQKTTLARYGVNNVGQNGQIKKLIRERQLEERAKLTLEEYRAKVKTKQDKMKQRYGNRYEKIVAKRIQTNMKRYGGPAPTCSSSVLKTRADNYFRKTGFTNPSQDPKIQRKIQSSKGSSKTVVVGSIEFTGMQGYEPQALCWMVNDKHVNPTRITIPDVSFEYFLDHKPHRYHPDFILKKRNRKVIVEVKSKYTLGFSVNNDTYHAYKTTQAKCGSVIDSGYEFVLLVVLDKPGWPVAEFYGDLRAVTKSAIAKELATIERNYVRP